MKKTLSLVLAISILFSMFAGFQSSAAVKNLMAATEEEALDILNGGYMPSAYLEHGYNIFGQWSNAAEDKISYSFDTETVKFGKRSVKIECKQAAGCSCMNILIPKEELIPGRELVLQCWIKTSKVMSAAWGAALSVVFDDCEEGQPQVEVFVVQSDNITGTKDWTFVEVPFVVPTDIKFIGAFAILRLWDALGTVWFDGLALVEGTKGVKEYDSIGAPSGLVYNPDGEATEPAKDPTPTEVPKPDVPSDWAKDEVAKAVEAKLVPEHINSKFTSNITRSDFCDLIINMITTKTNKAIADVIAEYADKKDGITFPDTTSENVLAAAALGIVNGRSSGAFDPDASITRQEAAKMLTLAAKVLGADTTASDVEFADAADIFAWAKEFINYVNSIDVMKGTNTATPPNFSPTKNYTREQSILTVYRLFNAIGK